MRRKKVALKNPGINKKYTSTSIGAEQDFYYILSAV